MSVVASGLIVPSEVTVFGIRFPGSINVSVTVVGVVGFVIVGVLVLVGSLVNSNLC